MSRNEWIGWGLGLVVAIVVGVGIVSTFDLHFPWTVILGMLLGFLFTMIGRDIGTQIDERDDY